MKDTPYCSFCGKPQGRTSNLILARKGRSTASICDECLGVCRKILAKSGTAPIADPPNTHYRVGSPRRERQLSCSFCGAPQHKAHRLIGSAPGLPPTYICDKCVARGDAAAGGGDAPSLGGWIARKLGRQQTAIHDLE